MKLFVIIATVVVCTCAAPTAELQHPSPVNPSVLVEQKPQEKIILITDPKEIAKYKRETKQPLYPTVLPREHVHHKPGHDAKAPETPKAPTVTKKPQAPIKPSLTKRNRRDVDQQKSENIKTAEFQKPQTLPVEETLESINKRRGNILKTNDDKETQKDKEDDKNVTTEVNQKSQDLPSNESTQQQKRDIPVPLVPKYHHPEESPKDTTEKEVQKEKQNQETEVLQKSQGVPAILSPSNDTPQKRDIPVPLVPKHQHPEESPKDINEKETHDDNKEINSENHHELQATPVQNHNRVTAVDIQNPQTLPLLLNERTGDKQQHKRDTPEPLIPKHHPSEESIKDSYESESHNDKKDHKDESVKENNNAKELHEQKKHIPQIHHISQTLPTYSHEHLNTQKLHKPQVLPVFVNDHISQSSVEKSQILPNLQDHITKNNNRKTEDDIHVQHISQPGHNQEHVEITGIHKPHALQTHHYEHLHQGVQKSQITPTVLKDSADATQHEESNISRLIVGHHKEEKQKESNENIKELKTGTENHPNKHEVQVEDLTESKPYQKPIHHGVPTQDDNKPNIQDDHLSSRDFTTSTTNHPAVRHRPVPVAELFARAHGN